MARTQVFNLSCVFTESGESRFSTTYCGYPNTQHYVPRFYSEKDDNVTLFYTSQDINLDTDYMNCKIIIPGHKTDLAPNI